MQEKSLALLRRVEVQVRTGLSRASIYDRLNPDSPRYDSSFPAPVRVGAMAVRWRQDEVEVWIASRPRTRAQRKEVGNV